MRLSIGDRVFSRRHKREIEVVRVSRAGVVGKKVKTNLELEQREVVVYPQDLTAVRLALPGVKS
ncbi:MAG: hypothetical protein KKE73_09625 [Proteobacteria bacterium]|nr:hypothetical protein [Pseudomonadota bacterium]